MPVRLLGNERARLSRASGFWASFELGSNPPSTFPSSPSAPCAMSCSSNPDHITFIRVWHCTHAGEFGGSRFAASLATGDDIIHRFHLDSTFLATSHLLRLMTPTTHRAPDMPDTNSPMTCRKCLQPASVIILGLPSPLSFYPTTMIG